MKFIIPFTVSFALALSIIACSPVHEVINTPTKNKPTHVSHPIRGLTLSQIAVVDINGDGISNAEILIGDKVGSPFPNNKITTNDEGVVEIPAAWNQELPVTITKDGFIKTSYLQQKPTGQMFEIHAKKATVKNEVKGAVNGFGSLPKDGFIDFGLVTTSLDTQSALHFDISRLISDDSDKISAMGQDIYIPTNVYLPRQRESYSVIPITLEKAFYRLFYNLNGSYPVQANMGKFDLEKVLGKINDGKSFFEVVNDLQFYSIGTATVDVNQQNVAFNLNGAQKKLVPTIDFTAAAPTTGLLYGISMVEDGDKLIPSDIKLRENKSQKLSLPEGAEKSAVLLVYTNVEKSSNGNKLSSSTSTALVDSKQNGQSVMLARINPPELTSAGLSLSKPALKKNSKGNLKAFATYAALSDVTNSKIQDINIEANDTAWEIYSPGWIDAINLPGVNNVNIGQRWEVVFYGIDSTENKQFNGPKTLNQATHAVQNAVNF